MLERYQYVCTDYGTCALKESDVDTGMDLWQNNATFNK